MKSGAVADGKQINTKPQIHFSMKPFLSWLLKLVTYFSLTLATYAALTLSPQTNSACQHLGKCMMNSMETVRTDVWV